MSQPSSDFETGEIGFSEAYDQPEISAPVIPAAPQYRQRGFSIYSVMLILSFVFLLIAAIVLFIEGDKY
jgi:hypothetical protein